jgi:hypothetical protein
MALTTLWRVFHEQFLYLYLLQGVQAQVRLIFIDTKNVAGSAFENVMKITSLAAVYSLVTKHTLQGTAYSISVTGIFRVM